MVQLMATNTSFSGSSRRPSRWSVLRGVTLIFGALVWAAAGLVGAALALFLAMMVVAVAAMSSLFLGLAAAAMKTRRVLKSRSETGLIEAHRIGGHSWVAYGWDRDA